MSEDFIQLDYRQSDEDLPDLDRALPQLADTDSRAARVVELRFVRHLQKDQVAGLLGLPLITVKRDREIAHACGW